MCVCVFIGVHHVCVGVFVCSCVFPNYYNPRNRLINNCSLIYVSHHHLPFQGWKSLGVPSIPGKINNNNEDLYSPFAIICLVRIGVRGMRGLWKPVQHTHLLTRDLGWSTLLLTLSPLSSPLSPSQRRHCQGALVK